MSDQDIKAGQVTADSQGGSLTGSKPNSETTLSPEQRAQMVAVAAYYKAEQRGFAAGHEMDDWLAAEQEFKALLEGLRAAQRLTLKPESKEEVTGAVAAAGAARTVERES